MADAKRLAAFTLKTVQAWVEPAFKAIGERLNAFEARLQSIPAGPPGAVGEPGRDGKDGAPGESIKGDPGAPGRDGKDADPEFLRLEVAKAFSEVPRPRDGVDGKDGKDGKDGADADPAVVAELVLPQVIAQVQLPAGPAGPPGAPGKDAEPIHPDTVMRMVLEQVGAAMQNLTLPKDGRDGQNGKDADPILMEKLIQAAVAALPQPKDGEPGKDADSEFIRAEIDRGIAAALSVALREAMLQMPQPKDGVDGKDGTDGKDGRDGVDGTNGQDGKDADPVAVKAMVTDEVQSIHHELAEMMAELSRGVQNMRAEAAPLQQSAIHLMMPGYDGSGKQAPASGDSDPSVRALMFAIAQNDRKRFAKAHYDADGRLIGVERVESLH